MLRPSQWPAASPERSFASSDLNLRERRIEPGRKFLRVIVGPEMHEEQARLVVEHVVVQRRHVDPVRVQRLDDWIDLVLGEYEVAGDRGLARAGGLEVD